jgi:ribosome-associated heat shock protein Hsp15
MSAGVRIDKWLWAVRIFKTRSQATLACRSGKVFSGEHAVKPSHEVKTGEIISVRFQPVVKQVKVLELLEKRVSAAKVPEYMEDMTPAEEYEKLKKKREAGFESRIRGLGRPTKRQRREIDQLKKYLGD